VPGRGRAFITIDRLVDPHRRRAPQVRSRRDHVDGDQRDGRSGGQLHGEGAQAEAHLGPDRLVDRVRSGGRHHGCRQRAGAKKADGEQLLGRGR
jgi:hypothetical protein